MNALKVNATARASISFYNNKKDIDKLISAIKDAHKIIG
jgi:selenocysteine lyase/cysteine desulfurase